MNIKYLSASSSSIKNLLHFSGSAGIDKPKHQVNPGLAP
jgi:hypothetical protein